MIILIAVLIMAVFVVYFACSRGKRGASTIQSTTWHAEGTYVHSYGDGRRWDGDNWV